MPRDVTLVFIALIVASTFFTQVLASEEAPRNWSHVKQNFSQIINGTWHIFAQSVGKFRQIMELLSILPYGNGSMTTNETKFLGVGSV